MSMLEELAELLASSSKITSRALDPLIMFALAASSQLAALAFYTIYMLWALPFALLGATCCTTQINRTLPSQNHVVV